MSDLTEKWLITVKLISSARPVRRDEVTFYEDKNDE